VSKTENKSLTNTDKQETNNITPHT